MVSTPILQPRGALLVDADNFHDAAQLRAVSGQFGQLVGKGFICHAHGDGKLLQSEMLKAVWVEMAAKLYPCLPLRKNTTDVQLVADALTLHFRYGVTRFGIASGDADFAPLAVQLRELGCEVTCYARMAIAFDAMVSYYDRVVRFDVLPPAPSVAVKGESDTDRPPAIVQLPLVAKPPTKLPAAKSVPQPAVPSKPDVVTPAAEHPVASASSADAQAVRNILNALPKWLPCTVKQLNQLGAPLRDKGVKSGNAPLHQLFRKYPRYFTVLPMTGAPRSVRLERLP